MMKIMRRNEYQEKIETRWQKALPFFKKRGHVLFVNPGLRFWTQHGFVQQSLANVLVENGIQVTWLDGAGWRSSQPKISHPSPLLDVRQIFELPLRRFSQMDQFNDRLVSWQIRSLLQKHPQSLLWIWGGMREAIVRKISSRKNFSIDVFSVFDDPWTEAPGGELCQKAKIITCQNPVAHAHFAARHPTKTHLVFPPVDLKENIFSGGASFSLPEGFPPDVMGYIGSLPAGGFDFVLLEDFVLSFPRIGFLLVGPGDAGALRAMNRLKRHANFHYVPWVDRSQIHHVWNLLKVSLLLYRPAGTNDGAFPVKVLEGLHFHVASVATRVPKTSGLEGYFPRSSFPEKLKALALTAMQQPKENLNEAYRHFSYEMHPKVHLSKIAEYLMS